MIVCDVSTYRILATDISNQQQPINLWLMMMNRASEKMICMYAYRSFGHCTKKLDWTNTALDVKEFPIIARSALHHILLPASVSIFSTRTPQGRVAV